MKTVLITLAFSIMALIAGVFLGGKYIGKGEVVISLCVMGDAAIEGQYLSKQKLLELAEKTGQKMRKKYPLLADNIELSDEAVERASQGSLCSQILVSLTKGGSSFD